MELRGGRIPPPPRPEGVFEIPAWIELSEMKFYNAETKRTYVLRTKANGISDYKEIFRFSLLFKPDYRIYPMFFVKVITN